MGTRIPVDLNQLCRSFSGDIKIQFGDPFFSSKWFYKPVEQTNHSYIQHFRSAGLGMSEIRVPQDWKGKNVM